MKQIQGSLTRTDRIVRDLGNHNARDLPALLQSLSETWEQALTAAEYIDLQARATAWWLFGKTFFDGLK